MIEISHVLAVALVVVGWAVLHVRRSVLGGVVGLMIVWQGLLALVALSVVHRPKPTEGAVLLWVFIFGAVFSAGSVLALGLRRYYADRDVDLKRNEEIRH